MQINYIQALTQKAFFIIMFAVCRKATDFEKCYKLDIVSLVEHVIVSIVVGQHQPVVWLVPFAVHTAATWSQAKTKENMIEPGPKLESKIS